jgi:CRP-like cAMP-binding protein
MVMVALSIADKQLSLFLEWAREAKASAETAADPELAACVQLLASMDQTMKTLETGPSPGTGSGPHESCQSFAFNLKVAEGRAKHQQTRRISLSQAAAGSAASAAGARPAKRPSFAEGVRRKSAASVAALKTLGGGSTSPAKNAGANQLSSDMVMQIQAIAHENRQISSSSSSSSSSASSASSASAAGQRQLRRESAKLATRAIDAAAKAGGVNLGFSGTAVNAMDQHDSDAAPANVMGTLMRKDSRKRSIRPDLADVPESDGKHSSLEVLPPLRKAASSADPDVGKLVVIPAAPHEESAPYEGFARQLPAFSELSLGGSSVRHLPIDPKTLASDSKRPASIRESDRESPTKTRSPLQIKRKCSDHSDAFIANHRDTAAQYPRFTELKATAADEEAEEDADGESENKQNQLMETFDELMHAEVKDRLKSKPAHIGALTGSIKALEKIKSLTLTRATHPDNEVSAKSTSTSLKTRKNKRRRSSIQLNVQEFLEMEVKHRQHGTYPLLRPGSTFQSSWALLVSAMVVYSIVVIPYTIAFDKIHAGWEEPRNLVPWSIFVVDLLLNFATGYNTDGYIVTDASHICWKYLGSWFLFDLCAVLPVDVIIGSGTGQLLKFTRLVRLLFDSEYTAAFRVKKLDHYLPENQMASFLTFVSVLMTLGTLVCVVHWSACVYWVLAEDEYFTLGYRACAESAGIVSNGRCSDWLPPAEVMEGGKIGKYNFAFFAMVTLTAGLGPGLHWPVHGTEIAFSSIMVVIGVFVISTTIGNVTSAIAYMKSANNENTSKWRSIKLYLHSRMVPSTMVHKIEDYYKFMWDSGINQMDRTVLKDLPASLQAELALHMNDLLVSRCPIFQGLTAEVTYELINAFEPRNFLPLDAMVRIGEPGREMFLLHRGFVRVHIGDRTIKMLEAGAFFGENAILYAEKPRTADCTSMSYCETLIINSKDFKQVAVRFPEIMSVIAQAALREQDVYNHAQHLAKQQRAIAKTSSKLAAML